MADQFLRVSAIIGIMVMLFLIGIVFVMHIYTSERLAEIKENGIIRQDKIVTQYYQMESCESKFLHLMKNDQRFWNHEVRESMYDIYRQECVT